MLLCLFRHTEKQYFSAFFPLSLLFQSFAARSSRRRGAVGGVALATQQRTVILMSGLSTVFGNSCLSAGQQATAYATPTFCYIVIILWESTVTTTIKIWKSHKPTLLMPEWLLHFCIPQLAGHKMNNNNNKKHSQKKNSYMYELISPMFELEIRDKAL